MKKISRRSESAHSTKDKRIRVVGTCRKVPLVIIIIITVLFAAPCPYYQELGSMFFLLAVIQTFDFLDELKTHDRLNEKPRQILVTFFIGTLQRVYMEKTSSQTSQL